MAAVHTGAKRSYEQMRGGRLDGRSGVSLPPSREQSPKVRSPFRSTSAAPGHAHGANSAQHLNDRPRQATFGTSASIVLVGTRGTGKSSLGVIAAAAYNYRLIESQRAFSDATGLSPSSYRAVHGNEDFQSRNKAVLEATLDTYTERTVIVCSFADLENGGASLLQDYAQAHPVIHITRDARGLCNYFRTWTLERVIQLLVASGSLLRACSNFEFFNLTEESHDLQQTDVRPANGRERGAQGRFLTLKRVERDFLRLLRNVVGDHGRSIAHHSAYPLSQIDVHKRAHTLAVHLDAQDIVQGNVDLEAAQTGVDCIELAVAPSSVEKRRRFQDIAHAFSIVRRHSILPIWLSPATGEGPHHKETQAIYDTINHCLSLGPEICSVDVNLDDAQWESLVKSKSGTKLVASSHFTQRLVEGWSGSTCKDVYLRAARHGFDLARITMPARSVEDTFGPKIFQSDIKRLGYSTGLIAYEDGPDGRSSKCYNTILTSVQAPTSASVSPADPNSSRTGITARSITEALFATFVLEPQRYYVYGRDVSYSLSPAMSNAAYSACGMRHELTTYNCADLEGFRTLVQEPDFGGALMLQPFKTVVMPMIDSVSSHAKAIGAVNTVIPIRRLNEDGSMPKEFDIISQRNRQGPLLGLYGTNTDWIGIRSCLRRGLSPANSVRPTSTGLVCGAGGMARAAIHSLASLGCQNIFICNRTPDHAHALAENYNRLIEAGDIPDLGTSSTSKTRVRLIESFADKWPSNARQPTMIACCIPADDADGTPIDFQLPADWLRSPTGGVVVEVAYKRPMTPLISQIRALADQGWILHDGFDVLPEQAYAQFEMFTGRRAPRKLMKDQVLKHYHAMTSAGTGD